MIENLIRNNPDAVLVCGKENLKFLEVNEVAINLYGYRRDEFLQMDLTDLYLTDDIQLLLDSSSSNIREGSFHGPYKHKKKDGSIIFVEMSRYSVKFEEHEAHFNLVRNITDKIENEKKVQSFKAAFDNSDDLIFITDSSGFIRFTNQQVTKKLGIAKNDLLNSSFTTLVSDEDRSRVNQSIFHSDQKDSSIITISLKTADGNLLDADLVASPIRGFDNEIESFTLIAKQKPVIDNIQGQQKLIKDVGKDGQKLDSKLLAGLFHELLTPINVILGFAQELTDGVNESSPELKEASMIIKQNKNNLLQSMNAAIEYASLSENESDLLPAETKITDMIDQLLKDVEELKGTLNVEFAYGKISSSLKFETDRQRFKYFMLLLFVITAKLSGQKKIFFSAYTQDKNNFIISFRDLQNHCSKLLLNKLQSVFQNDEFASTKEFEILKITLLLAQKLLQILGGRFITLNEEKDKYDYGILFPIKFKGAGKSKDKMPTTDDVKETKASKQPLDTPPIESEKAKAKVEKSEFDKKLEAKQKEIEELSAKIQNELKLEALREKIRRKEAQKKQTKIDNEDDENEEESDQDELVEDKIEFFDVDLQNELDEQILEDEIEIVETTAPKELPNHSPKLRFTDEKVDISNFSCLYIEDQVDSQVLYSVQMKGLKNLNFAVSFEESLPLLDSGNFDYILIDINLQGSYNGLDILRIIRSMPKYENTPIFAATAYILPGDQQKFVIAGFNGFIAKPIFRDEMIDLLAGVFNQHEKS